VAEQNTTESVNIELGDDISRLLYEASRLTLENRPGLVGTAFDSFSGFRAIDGDYLGDMRGHWLQMGLDGVGTKVEVAERTHMHASVAHDLFAMICDDAVVRGGEPLAVGTILDVRSLLHDNEFTRNAVRQLAEGYVTAAKFAGVVVVNGEVAELGARVDGYVDERVGGEELRFNYNWGGVVLWDALKSRALDGMAIKAGDVLVGFREEGFRSNGMTDVRRAMVEAYGPRWHIERFGELALGELVQTPSMIYCRVITDLTGGRDPDTEPKAVVHGVAHITGGGQPSKLARMLEPSGLGATIYNPFVPPEIMTHVQTILGLDDKSAYQKWHMGPGMVVATPEPDKVIAVASKHGVKAQEIGCVDDRPSIVIRNKGAQQQEDYLWF
jgi:phosphoribosylformylglycinamidine cyclo-ligase